MILIYNIFMIIKYFKRFFYFFKDYRKAFIKYSVLSVIVAILELFGIALTYPFIFKLLSKSNVNYIVTYGIGIAVVVLFLLKNLFMIFFTYVQGKFTNRFEIAIKKRLMNFFLNSEYQKTYKISLAEKNKIFGLLLSNVMNNFILRMLNLNINILIFFFIIVLIAVKFPLATMATIICAVLLLGLQNGIYKPLLTKLSKQVSKSGLLNNQGFNEAILNIKSIKISGNEKYFYNNFSKYLIQHYENLRKMNFLTAIPPFIVEPFAILLLFVLLFVISCQNYATPEKLVASFALVATAIFRLTPTIARIQVNLNGINSAIPMVSEFIDFYEKYNIRNIEELNSTKYIKFNDYMQLKNINFGYEQDKEVLKNINLTIRKGEFIGIAGLSGVGKTTLVDIIAGLYKPSSGEILIDDKVINGRLKIGYIPQEFCLISGNIRENVAFGSDEIDDERVIEALKKAQLYDFVKNNYKNGIYENPFTDSIGLSLGQKQRMAIARALYINPDILIFDEATSSLDLKTEDEICRVLTELKGQKTIIVIAHRLSTIKSADRIVFMENGTISNALPFEQLITISSQFNELVKISSVAHNKED